MAAELQATLAQLQQSFSATGDSKAVRLQADPVLQAAAAIHKWLDSIDHPGCKRLGDDEPPLAFTNRRSHCEHGRLLEEANGTKATHLETVPRPKRRLIERHRTLLDLSRELQVRVLSWCDGKALGRLQRSCSRLSPDTDSILELTKEAVHAAMARQFPSAKKLQQLSWPSLLSLHEDLENAVLTQDPDQLAAELTMIAEAAAETSYLESDLEDDSMTIESTALFVTGAVPYVLAAMRLGHEEVVATGMNVLLEYSAKSNSGAIQAMVSQGAVCALVQGLHNRDKNVQEAAALAIKNICAEHYQQHLGQELVKEGAIIPMLQILGLDDESEFDAVKGSVITALAYICENELHCKLVAKAGVARCMVEMLTRGTATTKRKALEHLFDIFGDNRAALMQAVPSEGSLNVVDSLVDFLQSYDEDTSANAAGVLSWLAQDKIQIKALVQHGVITPLVIALDSTSCQSAADALHSIMHSSGGDSAIIAAVIDAGVVGQLVQMLRSGDVQYMHMAAVALANLCTDAHIEQIVDADAIPVLVENIKHSDSSISQASKATLQAISTHKTHRETIKSHDVDVEAWAVANGCACPSKHPLFECKTYSTHVSEFRTIDMNVICDVCQRVSPLDSVVWACAICSWTRCVACKV